MEDDDEEYLPLQEADDEEPEDPAALMDYLRRSSQQGGPAQPLLLAGERYLAGAAGADEVEQRLLEVEPHLPDDPLLHSQLDRLQEGLSEGAQEQVLYALVGVAAQLNP